MNKTRLINVLELRSTYKGGGGPDKTILNSLRLHDNNVVNVNAIYLRGVNDTEFTIGKQAAELKLDNYFEVKEKGKFDVRVYKYLKDYIISNKIDIVHSHETKTNFYNFLFKQSINKNTKFVTTAHNWAGQNLFSLIYKLFDLKIIKRLDHAIAVSEFVKNILLDSGITEKKVSLVYNGIDTGYWRKKEETGNFRKEFHFEKCFPILGAVGRLMPEKDIYTMLKAFNLILNNFPEARLVLVGEGKQSSLRDAYLKKAHELEIEKNIVFMGYSRQLLEIYTTFDIYLMTSLTEGMPNVLLEAMAMELPIVSTEVGGVGELVINNYSGFLIQPKNYYGIAEKVVLLANDKEKIRKFGRNGRKIIKEKFDFNTRLRNIEGIYKNLLNQ